MTESFELEPELEAIRSFLADRGWLDGGESAERVALAGPGNMNRTLRVQTNRRSLILKQSRPYVVKFPDIPAPVERLLAEARFYELAGAEPRVARQLPKMLAVDERHFVALIEDLGDVRDLSTLYAEGRGMRADDLDALLQFAAALHSLPLDSETRRALSNADMRALNHEHIFDLPLRKGNGLDLDGITPGLDALAEELKSDAGFAKYVQALGEIYQADHPEGVLLHGDFYPGSFLSTPRGIRVIDPEFAFPGPAEFDLGVLAAHLVLCGEDANVADRIGRKVERPVDGALLRGFGGAEIMRRLIGVAQLPLRDTCSLDEKRAWLELARSWVVA